jgi:intracellular sulfur oxidation DsrE/DsrF family protein
MANNNRTVFHLIDGDADEQELAFSLAGNLANDEAIDMDDIAVLAQAEGIDSVTINGEKSDRVRSLVDEGISFKACSNTLEMFDLDESDLIDGVETVSSGVGELTRLQSNGYAYIRP